jgi:hypothetical protein
MITTILVLMLITIIVGGIDVTVNTVRNRYPDCRATIYLGIITLLGLSLVLVAHLIK